MSHAKAFLAQAAEICQTLDTDAIDRMAVALKELRDRGGRLFVLGVGGGAANACHAVNDFRKLCGIEAYAPTDNVSELTARTNDEGWNTVFSAWLRTSRLSDKDGLFIFSVGGGDAERNISSNIVAALDEATEKGASIFGVVGRQGGYTAKKANVVVIVPTVDPDRVTPHTEAFQAVVWHCLVSSPVLQIQKTTW